MKGRLFSEYYDSVRQRRQASRDGTRDLARRFFARLRFDSLLGKTIVLTDAQLLDGAFFLRTTPNALKEALRPQLDGWPPPIEVRAREDSLGQSLLAFVKDTRSPHLKGFTFSSIPDENVRAECRHKLECQDSASVRVWSDIPSLLVSYGLSKDQADFLERGWREWIKAQANGSVTVKRWDSVQANFAGIFEKTEPFEVSQLFTEEGRAYAQTVRDSISAGAFSRNKFNIECGTKKKISDNPRYVLDVEAIENWVNREYNRAVADQHFCDFESIESTDVPAINPLRQFADWATRAVSSDNWIFRW